MRLLNFRPKPEEQREPQFTPDWRLIQGTLPVEVKRNSKVPKMTTKAIENFAGVLFEQKLREIQ